MPRSHSTSASTALVAALSAFSIALAALTGCTNTVERRAGSSSAAATSAGDASSLCDSYCTKVSTCDSTVEAETCKATCMDDTSASAKRFRADVLAQVSTCFESSDCRQVLTGGRLSECIQEAAVSIAPSDEVKKFCDGLESAFEHCDSSFSRASCLSTMKTYSDTTLSQTERCFAKSCGQLAACIGAELDLDVQ